MPTVTEHESITYLSIAGDGQTLEVTEDVWSPAPAFKGMRSYWTVTGALVTVASRRHSVGYRAVSGRFMKTGGLIVEKGQTFREIDERSEMSAFVAKLRKSAPRASVDGGSLLGRTGVGLF